MDRKPVFALILGLLAVTGAWLLRSSTPFGLGLTDDAISYIASSRALLAGQGFTRIWLATGLEPITHWPPIFSFSLAAISRVLSMDPYRSARFLNILVFGANTAILATLGSKMTRSRLMGVFLAILFLSNSALIRLHAQALSEPLYLTVSLLAFLAFERAFASSHRKELHKWLIFAGFITGISYLTRYAALSLIATFILAIVILCPTWRKRFTSLVFFFVGVFPPIFAWMLRNKIVGGSATNRAIRWHPVTLENIERGLISFFKVIIPIPELSYPFLEKPFLLAIIPSLIALALLIWIVPLGLKYFIKPEENKQPEIISFTMALYIFGYMGSLLVSLTLFDAATPLNDRILSPVYLAVFILLVYFIHRLFQQGKIVPATILAIFVLSTSLIAQVRTVDKLQKSAMGFGSWRWRESTVMEAIRNFPEDVEIHTNQPPAVYFWTDRPAYRLWDAQPESFQSENAAIAIFISADDITPELQVWIDEMTEGFELVEKSGLGNLYRNK